MRWLREAWDVAVVVWHVAGVVFAVACAVLGVVVVLVAAVVVADLRADHRSARRAPVVAAGAELRELPGDVDQDDQDDRLDDGPAGAGELVEAR